MKALRFFLFFATARLYTWIAILPLVSSTSSSTWFDMSEGGKAMNGMKFKNSDRNSRDGRRIRGRVCFVSSGRGISRNGRKYTWGFGEKVIELIKRSFSGFISWGFEKESPWWNSRIVIGIPELEAGLEAGFCDSGKRNLWKWKEIIFFHKPLLCSLNLYFSFISKTRYNLVM